VGLLVLLSLALITAYFLESEEGGLHDAQSIAASALRPFQIGAERVARPFRDVYGYFAGLIHAKGEVERLKAELDELRQEVVGNEFAAEERDRLRAQLNYRGSPTFPRDFRQVSAEVIGQPSGKLDQEITVDAGKSQGVRTEDTVVTPQGLVGTVAWAARDSSLVRLITDESSGVSARVLRRDARGIVRPGGGASDSLVLERVTKDQPLRRGDTVVTAGWRSPEYRSLYPKGLKVGVVASVGQRGTESFKRIQVAPYVDFSSLDSVIVLVPRGR